MVPYYNTYYGRSYAIGYQCGICGRYARAQQRVPQCGVCLTPLCKTCNKSGFCPTHYAALTPADQARAQAIFLKSKRAMVGFIVAMVVGFTSFIIALPLSLTSSMSYSSSYIFVSIFVPMGIFMALIIGGAVYYQVALRRGWQAMQEIGQKYRTGQGFPAGGAPFPMNMPQGIPPSPFPPQYPYPSQATFAPPPVATPPTSPPRPVQPESPSALYVIPPPAPEPEAIPNKPAGRFCPYCGCRLAPAAIFCGNCGSALK